MLEKFLVLNIRDYLKQGSSGEDLLRQVFDHFSCTHNLDVHRFLVEQSIDFTKKNQSVTYLVFTPDKFQIIGYFTIAIKPITVDVSLFSNSVKRKLARISKQDKDENKYTFSAYLIAQLGKNFLNHLNERITGKELLELAIMKIKELQYRAGGLVVFLESENDQKLLDFYQNKNGFKRFDLKEIKSNTSKSRVLIQMLRIL